MAVHPFAQKAEAMLAALKELRANLRKAKKAAKAAEGVLNPNLRGSTNTGEVVNLGNIGIGGVQVGVTPGGGLGGSELKPTPALLKLKQKLIDENRKCSERYQKVAFESRYVNGIWQRGGTNVNVSDSCPGAIAVQKQIQQLIERGGAYTSGR